MNGFVDAGAVVSGVAAEALARHLVRDWQQGRFAYLDPELQSEVAAAIRAVRLAGDAYMRRRPSAVGSSEVPRSPVPASLAHDSDDMAIEEAAAMLGLTDRRVRQLAADGVIPARKRAGVWTLDRAAVLLEVERRSAA